MPAMAANPGGFEQVTELSRVPAARRGWRLGWGGRSQPLLPSGAAMCQSCLSDGIFMGADGCQGNGGFGEPRAPQPRPGSAGSRCWLTPGAASAAHAGAAEDAVPGCTGGPAPAPRSPLPCNLVFLSHPTGVPQPSA